MHILISEIFLYFLCLECVKKYTNKVTLCPFFFLFFFLNKKNTSTLNFRNVDINTLSIFFFMRCSYFWNQTIKEYIFTFDRLKTNNGTYQKTIKRELIDNARLKKKKFGFIRILSRNQKCTIICLI